MKIIITGGAGFIGSHIVDKLIKQKNKIIIIDDLSTGKKENINKAAKFYKINLQNFKELEKIFKKEKPNFVCHQGAHASVRESVEDPIFDAKTNILGTINIASCCIKYKVKKLVFASTGGALYGDAKILPTPETYPAKPVSPYGVSKLSGEQYLYCFNFLNKLNYIILRYANVYGPRQDPFGEAGVVAIFSQKIVNNEQPTINGSGQQTRDFVYIDDIVGANLKALKSASSKNIFNVGTGIQININKIFQTLVKVSGKKVKEVHTSAKPGEQKTSALDYSKIKKKLNWEPEVKLEDGLKETYDWFLKKS